MTVEAIPAATLVVFRESPVGPPELLIVERGKGMAFAAGALVFPGGRIDPGDHDLAAALGAGEDGPARVAAVRETIEEAGVAIGIEPALSAEQLASIRVDLHRGAAFGDALARAGARLDLGELHAFARWLPAHAHMRIFDTQFFLARLPAGAPAATVDATENVRLFWATAAQVLADADAGRATIIYPTRRNLERLAGFAGFDEAVADARAHPIRTITPFVEDRDGVPHLCIPADLGYPVTAERMSETVRG